MPDPTEPIVVMMTASSAEEAKRIAESLVNQKLAACVQILPGIESVYAWKGETQSEPEVLVLAKTTRNNFAELERQVRALHSYETPEIIALPIVTGSQPYLEWLSGSCEAS